MAETLDPTAVKYDDRGLVTAIVQDADSHEILMVAYMNQDTLRRTLEIGQAVFWSRSRSEIWHKGATSGDYIEVLSIATDCDADALVVQGRLLGSGACHTGARSCFIDEHEGASRAVRLEEAPAPR